MLSESALHTIIEKIETREFITEYEYAELLTLAFLALVCSEEHDVRPLLLVLSKRRQSFVEENPANNNLLHWYDEAFAQALHATILSSGKYKMKTQIVQEYILKTDLAWANQIKASGSSAFSYTDYSSTDTTELFKLIGVWVDGTSSVTELHDIADRIIEHIDLRLKELNQHVRNSRQEETLE